MKPSVNEIYIETITNVIKDLEEKVQQLVGTELKAIEALKEELEAVNEYINSAFCAIRDSLSSDVEIWSHGVCFGWFTIQNRHKPISSPEGYVIEYYHIQYDPYDGTGTVCEDILGKGKLVIPFEWVEMVRDEKHDELEALVNKEAPVKYKAQYEDFKSIHSRVVG